MPTTASPQEHSPLLPVYVEPNYGRGNGEGGEDREDDEEGGRTATQVRVGELLENKKTHRFLLALIAIDGCFVLLDLGWNILNPNCDPGEKDEAPAWLEHLALFSLCIDFLFLLEIPAALYAFGWRFYGLSMTEKAVPHYALHLFDALIIIGTVVLEVFLSGKERELAGLLIILRFWRIVKLVGATAVGVGEWDEAAVTAMGKAKTRIAELEKEVAGLKVQVAAAGGASAGEGMVPLGGEGVRGRIRLSGEEAV